MIKSVDLGEAIIGPGLSARVAPRPAGEKKAPKPSASPYLNRHLVKKLQALGSAQGAQAKELFDSLPATPKAVVALCCYLGHFHRPMHLSKRLRRQRFVRGILRAACEDSPEMRDHAAKMEALYGNAPGSRRPKLRYLQCCCGMFLDASSRMPVEPAEADPEVLTLGILSCARCSGTAYDALENSLPGENLGTARKRIGYHPDSRQARITGDTK